MKWIETIEIRNWAERRDCQDSLPQLIRKLIRATSNSIKSIKFPSGENVLIGGWDGILEVSEETEYLPLGVSLWEMGTNSDIKKKAEADYEKRSKNPLGYNPGDSTFVFVTPRLWTKGDKWAEEKKKEGIWKDIRVIDAEKIDEWLEIAPTVSAWLAIKHLGKYPSDGIQSTDDFWEEWSAGPKIKLNPEILLGGRKEQVERIIDLSLSPNVTAIEATSREEALAFIVSCFKNNPDKEEDFFARSVIVDNVDSFRRLSVLKNQIILIPRFEDIGILNRAVANGHTVFTPLSADSSANWSNKIVLPHISRESFIEALVKSGITKDLAEKYSKESARNITILRRQLEFTRNVPEWSKAENVREIVPALLVGRWNENSENDRNILTKISGENYDEYSKKLNRWLQSSDSPLVKIGDNWRLASPLDSWINASKYLTKNDFNLLHSSFNEVLNEIDPAFDLDPGKRHMSIVFDKKMQYSTWIREGMIQSLVLISIFDNQLHFDLPITGGLWVDSIIKEFLNTNNPFLWKSIEGKLPLIAEASPKEFLSSVEYYLSVEKSPVAALFEEEPGFLTSHSYHTGLLWALENLAWVPEYLSRVSVILAKLSAIDPGGSLSNRPINSLVEIFKPWHYQTFAPFEERMEILRLLTKREKDVAWTLLIRLLPEPTGGIAMPTNRMRWRLFEHDFEIRYTYQEIFKTHSEIVDILLSIFDWSESKLENLIEVSVNLLPKDRNKILTFLDKNTSIIQQTDYLPWHKIRSILSHHRSYPDAKWALSEAELKIYDKLYLDLQPSDSIKSSSWVFDEYWPKFPEGSNYNKVTHDEQEKIVHEKRIEILKSIYNQYGINKIIELSTIVKEPSILGDTLAYFFDSESEILPLCELLYKGKNDYRFIQSFLFRRSIKNGINWILELFQKLWNLDFDNYALAELLVPVIQTKELWDFVNKSKSDIKELYWIKMTPRFWNLSPEEKVMGINNLIEYKRYFTAIDTCSHTVNDIPIRMIETLLEKAATEGASEEVRFDGYEVGRLFEAIDKRMETDKSILIKLEWLYLPFLASYGNTRSPKLLHEEIASNPEFFIDLLKWAYKPNNDELLEEERKELSEEQIKNRANNAFQLLHSWKKIPGIDENGKINTDFLNSWVRNVRDLAAKIDRAEVADDRIGQVLAQYPENDFSWPPDEICNLIETINNKDIKTGFSVSTFNKRGSSTRGAYDGGNIEREHAKYFDKLSNRIRNKFPNTAAVLDHLARNYEVDAKRMDESAEKDKLEY